MGEENNIIFSDAEKFARLQLIRSQGVGPATFSRLIRQHGTALSAISVVPPNKLAHSDKIKREIEVTREFGAHFVFLGSANYPARLAAIPDAPPVFTIKGDLSLASASNIGVVGARNASASGIKITKKICADLSAEGVIITSGLARGIDSAAHISSITSGTIACLAGGIDFIYPPENRELYEKIAASGLLVSEMPFGTKPQARHFPRRNRIISGLCEGLLVIEAARKSGSLITARFAADQGRDVFAVPGSPLDPRAQGTNQLIKDGAILTQCADDILHELTTMPLLRATSQNLSPNAPLRKQPEREPVIPTAPIPNMNLIDCLSADPIHIDEIVRLTGRPAQSILGEFMTLELSGDIVRHSGNRFSRFSSKNE